MGDGPNDYEFPFRKNFEMRIMLAWFVTGIAMILAPIFVDVPFHTYRYFGIGFIIFGLVVGRKGMSIYHKKARLRGYKVEVIDTASSYVLNDLFMVEDKDLVKTIIDNNTRKNREAKDKQ